MIYTNYETKKIIESVLDSADLYTDAMNYIDELGNFTAETIEEHLENSPFFYRNTTGADWQQIADSINADH